MVSATTSLEAALDQGDLACAYEIRDDEVLERPYRAIDTSAPAGQLIYHTNDAARWLCFQAGGGELEGRRLISEEGFEETRSIQIPFSLPPLMPDEPEWGPRWLGYGLGWAIAEYRGRPMLYHSGGIDGFSLPATSPARHPNVRSAAGFQTRTSRSRS